MTNDENMARVRRKFFRAPLIFFGASLFIFCRALAASTVATNLPPPVTPQDFFNAGTRQLAATNFVEAERMFHTVLSSSDEKWHALAEYNLGHTRYADGVEILKKGPDAQKVSEFGHAALTTGESALRSGEAALADNNVERIISAYMAGRGARQNLRAAEKAVKAALQTHGKTLSRWQRSLDDFKGAAELNPADTNATHNAEFVQKKIAALVDLMQQMQQMAGEMAGQKEQLGKMLSKMKGQMPALNAPPGGKGEDDEEEKDDGSGKSDVKPESLAGKEEGEGREGEQMRNQLAPDQAGRILESLPVDGSKRLPMGGDKQGEPAKDKKDRNW